MNRKVTTIASLVALAGLGCYGAEDENDTPQIIKADTFVILPLHATELQQRFLPELGDPANAKAYVLINGAAAIDERGRIDPSALHLDELREMLRPFSDREQGMVVFHAHFGSASGEAGRLLAIMFEGAARHCGFRAARVLSTHHNDQMDWEAIVAPASIPAERPRDETAVQGSELILAYPVTSAVSRLLTSSSDCVVVIVPPFEGESDGRLDDMLRKAIELQVGRLMLTHKDKILFSVTSRGTAGREAAERFVEFESQELAESLGFARSSVRHGPQ